MVTKEIFKTMLLSTFIIFSILLIRSIASKIGKFELILSIHWSRFY